MITPELPNNFADQVAERAVQNFRFDSSSSMHVEFNGGCDANCDLRHAQTNEEAEQILADYEEGMIEAIQEFVDDGLEVVENSPLVVTAEEMSRMVDEIFDAPNGTELGNHQTHIEHGMRDFMLANRINNKYPKTHEAILDGISRVPNLSDYYDEVAFIFRLISIIEEHDLTDEQYADAFGSSLNEAVDDFFELFNNRIDSTKKGGNPTLE